MPIRATLVFVVFAAAVIAACEPEYATDLRGTGLTGQRGVYSGELARQWMDAAYVLVRDESLSPPRAARAYAYIGVAMYEALRREPPGAPPLLGLRADIDGLPQPASADYHWPTVAAAAVPIVGAAVSSPGPAERELGAIRDIQLQAFRASGVSESVTDRSLRHGEALGNAIAEWARTDGADRAGGASTGPPVGADRAGAWVPTESGQLPLEPGWSNVRTLVLESADACAPPPPVPYSEDPASQFHSDAWVVYETGNRLSAEQRFIADFWSDAPGDTGTPPGHWVRIAEQLSEDQELSLTESAAMFAALGIAVHDAFVSCWQSKYDYGLLRPVTYIRAQIEPSWESYVPSPPFPEYTSGHSVVSGAAATVLGAMLGPVGFTDRSHHDEGLEPRSFRSVGDAAGEAAISRLYGGIHFRPSIEDGLDQGECVGLAVLRELGIDARLVP